MRKPTPCNKTWIPSLCRMYAAALWLYPRSHRERWGVQMQQAFRDRCREAMRDGRSLLQVVCAELLPDLVASACRERFITPRTTNQPGGFMHKLIGTALILVGALFLALSATALWNNLHSARFAHPGAFDALGILQIAFGVAGLVLSVIGLRQARSQVRPSL